MIKLSDDSPTDNDRPDSRQFDDDGLIGTRLRDAAVDPRPGDFLVPTKAGEADPHGPEVIAPEIHASEGVRPVKGGEVHVDDPDAQDAAETEHTSKVQDEGAEVSAVPAGNASRETWEEYALANGRSAEDLEGLSRNEIRDLFAATE